MLHRLYIYITSKLSYGKWKEIKLMSFLGRKGEMGDVPFIRFILKKRNLFDNERDFMCNKINISKF